MMLLLLMLVVVVGSRLAEAEEGVIASLWRFDNRLRVTGRGCVIRGRSHKGIMEHAIADIVGGRQATQ